MKRILITGGCGFLGTNLALYFQKLGYEVIILDIADRFMRWDNLRNSGIKFYFSDMSKQIPKIKEKIDFIIHLAAWPHVDFSHYFPDCCLQNNILSTIHLIRYSIQNDIPILFSSSVEVYGGRKNHRYHENSPLDPVSAYGISKKTCEEIINLYMNHFSLKPIIIRLTNLYGPYQLPDRVIPRLITRALLGKTTDIERSFERDFLYVDDGVSAIEKLIQFPKFGEIYNISSGCWHSIDNVSNQISDILGFHCASYLESIQAKKPRGEHLKINNQKIKEELSWKPKVSISEGLKNTVVWYKQNENWWAPLKETLLKDRNTSDYIFDFTNNEFIKGETNG